MHTRGAPIIAAATLNRRRLPPDRARTGTSRYSRSPKVRNACDTAVSTSTSGNPLIAADTCARYCTYQRKVSLLPALRITHAHAKHLMQTKACPLNKVYLCLGYAVEPDTLKSDTCHAYTRQESKMSLTSIKLQHFLNTECVCEPPRLRAVACAPPLRRESS